MTNKTLAGLGTLIVIAFLVITFSENNRDQITPQVDLTIGQKTSTEIVDEISIEGTLDTKQEVLTKESDVTTKETDINVEQEVLTDNPDKTTIETNIPSEQEFSTNDPDEISARTSIITEKKTWDVIIIGAGIAGLATAEELTKQGVDNVLILEARDRIGGRIWTDTIGDNIPVDLGASWIHGVNGNPIAQIVAENNITTVATDYENEVEHTPGVLSNPVRGNLWEEFEDFAYDQDGRSIQNNLEAFVEEEDLNKGEVDYLEYLINTTIEHELGADVSNLSIKNYDGGKELSGGDVLFPGGYDQIINILAQNKNITLEQPVTSIDYSGELISIETNSGDTFITKQVVVTVPLGVLKKGYITFDPQLPVQKRTVIDRLGMGVLNKTYLLFDEVFWEKDIEIIGYVGKEKGHWAETLNLYPYTQEPILLMFNAGDYGTEIEQNSDQKTVNEAMNMLREIYGANTPNPIDSVITRWNKDQWSGGSYSYVPTGASFDDYETLGESINDKFFLLVKQPTPTSPLPSMEPSYLVFE